MDVHHLRYFVEVAHAGTIAAAGRSLAVSASPLSRRIADLERYMGGPLFVRGGRMLELTESGSALLPVAERVLADFAEVEALRARTRRILRVGLVPRVTEEVTALLEAAVATGRPHDDVEYEPAPSPVQNVKVLDGMLDMATVRVVGRDPRLNRLPLAVQEIHVLVAPMMLPLLGAPLRPRDLAGWTLYSSYPVRFSDDLDRFLDEQGVDDVRVLPAADQNALSVLLQHGRRFTLTAGDGRIDHAAPLVRVQLTAPILATTWLVWRRDRSDLQDVIEAVRPALRAPSRTDPVRPADQIGC
jgi:DNA-binding transcriptional LysR family regulator